MSAEWSQVVVHMSRQAKMEAFEAALTRTGDRVHALNAGRVAVRESREKLEAWGRQRGLPKANLAAQQFFKTHPGLRPRTAAEAADMAVQAEVDYIEARTRIVPGKYVLRTLNGKDVIEPLREWHLQD